MKHCSEDVNLFFWLNNIYMYLCIYTYIYVINQKSKFTSSDTMFYGLAPIYSEVCATYICIYVSYSWPNGWTKLTEFQFWGHLWVLGGNIGWKCNLWIILIPLFCNIDVVDISNYMNSVRSKSLKYQWFTPTGCKDEKNLTFEFLTKTQLLLDKGNIWD